MNAKMTNSQRKKAAAEFHDKQYQVEQARLATLTPQQRQREIIEQVVVGELKLVHESLFGRSLPK